MKKILVIEDNNEINSMLATALSKSGYLVKSAFSGTEGLLYFSMEEAFSLVVLDLMLPGLSGEEVLAKLREKTKVPIIVISAKSEITGKVELLEKGADDYITKPFYIEELREHTGLEECVKNYVMEAEESQEFLKKVLSLLEFSVPLYAKEADLLILYPCFHLLPLLLLT